jgi:hypothetical protein
MPTTIRFGFFGRELVNLFLAEVFLANLRGGW